MTFTNVGLDAVLNRGSVTSLECPTMIARGAEPPAMAIVEQLALGQCRIRSVAKFENGDLLEMPLSVPGAPKLTLHGRVITHTPNGARSSYELALLRLSVPERADFEKLLAAATRYAASHTPKEAPAGVSGLTRTSPRVPVDTAIRYRVDGRESRMARTTNISVGGIQMKCADPLQTGSTVELYFTLPFVEIVPAPKPIELQARIVAQQATSDGGFSYNIAFYNVQDAARDQIARYVSETLVNA